MDQGKPLNLVWLNVGEDVEFGGSLFELFEMNCLAAMFQAQLGAVVRVSR